MRLPEAPDSKLLKLFFEFARSLARDPGEVFRSFGKSGTDELDILRVFHSTMRKFGTNKEVVAEVRHVRCGGYTRRCWGKLPVDWDKKELTVEYPW